MRSTIIARFLRGPLGAMGLAIGFTALTTAAAPPRLAPDVPEIRARLLADFGAVALAAQSPAETLAALTADERARLGRNFLRFELHAAAEVAVVLPASARNDPFWLAERGFRAQPEEWRVGGSRYVAWTREFPAGRVELGVPPLGGNVDTYFVVSRPSAAPATPLLSGLTPSAPFALELRTAEVGQRPYVDERRRLELVPEHWNGAALLATANAAKTSAHVYQWYRLTRHPSGPRPDEIVLLWSDDPRTTQTVRWRTRGDVTEGFIAWAPRASGAFDPRAATVARTRAEVRRIESADVANDPVESVHFATLTGLEPGTTYHYAVGDGSPAGWSAPAEFTTAPAASQAFSFVYLGDAQNGLDRWGELLRTAFAARPDAAFYLLAGDLVNHGQERDDWDHFFANTRGVFDRRPLLPAIGNHEDHGGHPTLYLRNFHLPANGPPALERGRAYSLTYGDVLFVVLDSNLPAEQQAPWLDATLGASQAAWKIVMYHHPAYASRPGRSYPGVNNHWVPLFDRHRVDWALQGHDHAYLRTHPLRAGQPVSTADEGTFYVISVGGTKMYEQGRHAYTAVGFTDTRTFQVFDVDPAQGTLRYRAYDASGALRDEVLLPRKRR